MKEMSERRAHLLMQRGSETLRRRRWQPQHPCFQRLFHANVKARENSPFSLSTKQNGPVFQNRKTNAVFLFCFPSAMVLLAAGASPGAAPCNTPPLHLLPPFNPKAGRAGWRGQIKSCRPARRKLYHCAGQKAQRHGLVSKSFVLLAGKTMISRSQRTGFARPPRRSRERERETRGGAVR